MNSSASHREKKKKNKESYHKTNTTDDLNLCGVMNMIDNDDDLINEDTFIR